VVMLAEGSNQGGWRRQTSVSGVKVFSSFRLVVSALLGLLSFYYYFNEVDYFQRDF
jgi:hypothetical protein